MPTHPVRALFALLVSASLAGCSMFSSSTDETAAEQSRRIQEEVGTAVVPLKKEIDELRQTSDVNTREIGVLKTEVEMIKQDASRRPVITPTEIGETPAGDGEEERLARQRAIEERIAREKAEAERLAREQGEADRRAREKAETERLAREQEKQDRAAEEERLAREAAGRNRKTEEQRLAREQAEQERKAEEERRAREKADQERVAREKPDREPAAAGDSPGSGTAKAGAGSPGGGFQVPQDAAPEEKAALLTNALRTTSDVEAVARQMRGVSAIVGPSLIRMLSDSDITSKFRAEKALGFLDPKVVLPMLIDQLKKTQTQLATIKILGTLGDPGAIPNLSGFLAHDNRDLRFYAADSLVKLRDKRAIPHLIDYLKGSDTAKCAIAHDTLKQRTGQNLPFRFFGSREEREKDAAGWEQWWKENGERFEFK